MEDFHTFELSELDQIMPRLYIRWLLCIPFSQASPSKAAIINSLQGGIKTTVEKLPFLLGVVVSKSSDPSRLEIHLPRERHNFELRVQNHDSDHDETLPTYESLEKAEFPASSLPDNMLTPPDIDPRPAFDMMATFIRGGLLLCIKCHHAAADGGGLGLIVKFLAQNCYAHPAQTTLGPTSLPSIDRSNLPRERDLWVLADTGFNFVNPVDATQKPTKDYASMTSHTFKFGPESLRMLKSLCITGSERISTQDALTALLYGSVSHARGLRNTKTSTTTTALPSVMGIAVNGRGRLNPPVANYAGNCTLYATFSNPIVLPVEKITDHSFEHLNLLSQHLNLPSLASKTRASINAVTHDSIVSTISAAASLEEVSRFQPSFADFLQGADFFITSGADFPVFEQEWWAGGMVDALRIPFKGNWDGSCAVLATKDRSKGLDIMLGLRDDDMALVKEILLAFGAHIV
ncbi:hypothetical protein ACEPPN_016820 [Leptodophora sp. 'Broadleaf-Isolate-01']